MRLKFRVFTKGVPEFEVAIKDGLTLGRRGCDVNLSDKRVSSKHAHIDLREGEWVLADDGSHNGLITGGQRQDSIPLVPGQEIFVGSARLVVLEDEDEKNISLQEIFGDGEPDREKKSGDGPGAWTGLVAIPQGWGGEADKSDDDLIGFSPPEERAAPPLAPKAPDVKTWRTRLQAALRHEPAKNQGDLENAIFHRPVRLSFTGGPLYETTADLLFGPRTVGPSGDICLCDTYDAPVYFLLSPSEDSVLLATNEEVPVLVNGSSANDRVLRDGDEITVGTTVVTVEYLDAV